MRIQEKALTGLVRVTVAVAASLGGVSLWASSSPLKIGVGRIVPVAYLDGDGKAVGFAVDVTNEAARRERIAVSWLELVKGVGEDLQSDTIDLLSAGMATAERKQKFYVSEPWWYQELALLTRAESPQPIKRLGLQDVYVEFARPYLDPTTFVIEAHDSAQPAAIEARAVCKGALDGALITHGELHDIFLNRPEECEGVRLQSLDTAITYGLSILSRKSDEAIARRLRRRIDDLILDGTLLRFAAAHPPISISGAIHLQERIRHRYHNRMWIAAACIVLLVVAFLAWFLWDRQRDLIRTRRSESELRNLHQQVTKANGALSETNAQLEAINRTMGMALDASKSGAWECNLETGEVVWTDTYCRLLGVDAGSQPSDELLYTLVYPDDREPLRKHVEASIRNRRPEFRTQFRIWRPDGVHWFERRGHVIRDLHGNPVRLIGITTDITEQKVLRGLLPTCTNCKKIRDEHGHWQELEIYISDRSDAQFTHGICPDCYRDTMKAEGLS